MHTAYSIHQLLKLPLTIECLASFKDHLLIGTKQGHLLMYSVRTNGSNSGVTAGASDAEGTAGGGGDDDQVFSSASVITEPKSDEMPRVQLLRTNKFFSKKPITQLVAVQDYWMLIALCDSVITVHDMDLAVISFPCIYTVQRAKGASAFAVDVIRTTSLTGEISVTDIIAVRKDLHNFAVRMVVAVRKKLQFYYWKNRKFMDLYPDVTVPDLVRSVAWCKDSVCVGFRGEYSLIKMSGEQELCELFPTGRNQEASVTLLSDERFALGKDEQTTFIDLEGNMKLYAVSWSETPQELTHDFPYLLAVLSKTIEVRTDEPRLHIQSIELPGPKFVSSCGQGLVYVASQSNIWLLQMSPVQLQIPQLLRDKQFELAVTLSNLGDDPLDSKTKRVQRIQTLYAFDLFCNHRFKDSMDVFYQLDIDASHVIGLFSGLLPHEYHDKLRYPDKPPVLQGRDLEGAILALVEYLTQVRHRLNGLSGKAVDPLPIVEGCTTIKSKKHLLQVLDTTLLKCYLKTNDALVAPLLRLKENNCHQVEVENALRKSHKFAELVIFYNTRSLHRKALELLREHRDKLDSPLQGRLKTVQYLHNLGPEHVDLICEFAAWVLDADETDGLSIFTEDVTEVETLPRAKVLEFLSRSSKSSAVISYLKHVILQWSDPSPIFHNALVLRYKDHIVSLLKSGEMEAAAKERVELMEFLNSSSSHYAAEIVLPQFPHDCLQEERATLLGKLIRHREALILYLFHVKDPASAKKYCQMYNKAGSDVYTTMVELLLKPPEKAEFQKLGLAVDGVPAVDVQTALEVLDENGLMVDLNTVLDLMPDDVPLHRISKYLSAKMEERLSQMKHLQVRRGLMHAEHLQVQEQRIILESQKEEIGEFDVCRVCHKRFNNQGAVVRLPHGQIVHYSCQEKAYNAL